MGDLYVQPEFRRRGIGRALLVAAAEGLDREYLVLTTETRNEPARAYYSGLGFPRGVGQLRHPRGGACSDPAPRPPPTAPPCTSSTAPSSPSARTPTTTGRRSRRSWARWTRSSTPGWRSSPTRTSTIEGFALARRKRGTHGVLTDLYVRPEARRKGVATALAAAVADALAEMGATHVTLSVDVANAAARAAYASWGFRDGHLTLVAEIERAPASPRIDSGNGAELWFRPRSDRRHRRCHARGRAVHPAADRTFGGDGRRAAAQRLDRRLRRGRRPRAGAPPPPRPRAVRPDGRRDPLDRRRARAGRPLPALRARADRGRVPVRPSSTMGSWRRATRSPSERIRRWSRG